MICQLFAIVEFVLLVSLSPLSASSIRGQVSDHVGVPMEEAIVMLGPTSGNDQARIVLTGPDGRFRFADLSEGSYSLPVVTFAFVPWQRRYDIAQGEDFEISPPLALKIGWGRCSPYDFFWKHHLAPTAKEGIVVSGRVLPAGSKRAEITALLSTVTDQLQMTTTTAR